jgi:inorganic pyrophosphatase/exopolyphosphatase
MPDSFTESLPEYLDRCKREIFEYPSDRRDPIRRFHFVIGNEAGDADSVVSALSHAYLSTAVPTSHRRISLVDRDTGQEKELGDDTALNDDNCDCLVVPVVPIPQEDFITQRPETLYLLRTLAEISPDRLLYIDEWRRFLTHLPREGRPDADHSLPLVRLTLLDHNRFNSSRLEVPTVADSQSLDSRGGERGGATAAVKVVRIMDHHRDEGCHLETCPPGSSRRTVAYDAESGRALVASACTLVVEKWLLRKEGASEEPLRSQAQYIPTSLSVMLLGTILLDSVNQDPRAGKVTDRDREAIQALLTRTDWSQLTEGARRALSLHSFDDASAAAAAAAATPDLSVLFELLQSSKFDVEFWSSLSVRDALRLDFKQFRAERTTRPQNHISTAPESPSPSPSPSSSSPPSGSPPHLLLGMSTVLLNVRDFVSKRDAPEEIKAYMRLHGLDLLVITLATRSKSEEPGERGSTSLKRQLILCDMQGGAIVKGLVEHILRRDAQPDLQLAEIVNVMADTAGCDTLYLRAFDQRNAKASRKTVAPLVIDYFEAPRL